jgi:WD40 repeat protein
VSSELPVDKKKDTVLSLKKITSECVSFLLRKMGQSNSVPLVGGISYDAFSVYAASIKIPTHIVDVKATFDRYKDPNSNLISSETVMDLQLKTDVFLTHDWGIDELGRVNHDRVAAINKELKSLGFVTWFDSERMTGEVVYQMANGINNTSVVIVFITQRYMNKVNGPDTNDNCRKEFNYAVQKKSSTKMIPVVMEHRVKDIRGSWDGVVQLELGNILYVDFSNDNNFQSAIQQLKVEILSRTNPLWVLRSTPLPEITTPPPPPPILPSTVSTPNDTDRLMIDQLSSWFGSIHISSAVARRYAELLVEKNSGSITKLQRKLERNCNYLEEIGGFDEDDIIDIKEGLGLATPKPEDNNSNKKGGEEISLAVTLPLSDETLKSEKQELKEAATTDSVVPVARTTRIPVRSSESHSMWVSSLSWDPAGKKIVSGSQDRTIKIWDGKSLELLKTLKGHSFWVTSVSWNRDGSKIVSGSGTWDATLKIWDSSTGSELYSLKGHSDGVLSVAWNRDDSKIVSGSADKMIKIWGWVKATVGGLMTWELLKTLDGHSHSVTSVSWNHDGTKIVSGSNDNTIKIWESSIGKLFKTLTGHSHFVYSVSWSHDDSKIVSGSNDKTVCIWNAFSGDLINTLDGHSGWVRCVAWSPDGRKIASCSPDGNIIIWDTLTGQEMNSIQSVKDVSSVTWNHEGSELVCNDDNEICVFSFVK